MKVRKEVKISNNTISNYHFMKRHDTKHIDHEDQNQRLDSPQTDIKRSIEIPRILVQLFFAQRLFLDGRPGETKGGDVVLLARFFRHVVVFDLVRAAVDKSFDVQGVEIVDASRCKSWMTLTLLPLYSLTTVRDVPTTMRTSSSSTQPLSDSSRYACVCGCKIMTCELGRRQRGSWGRNDRTGDNGIQRQIFFGSRVDRGRQSTQGAGGGRGGLSPRSPARSRT